MYRFWRHWRFKTDKSHEGFRLAKEVADYLTTKYPEHTTQVYSEVFGDLDSVYWFSDYKDLADLESLSAQLDADKDYSALVDKFKGLLIDGTGHDTLAGPV
jgi:hypothetical protein